MRLKLIAAVGASLALVPAAPASAGTLTVPNACFWSVPGGWFDQSVEITGAGSPNPAAPGSGVTLTGASARSPFPSWIYEYTEFFQPGENRIEAKVWIALAADGASPATQTLYREVTTTTVKTVHADGTETITPIDVTVPLPDTAWAGPATEGAAAFKQASAGALGTIPGGVRGQNVDAKGSVFILAMLPTGVGITIDCQPGTAPGRVLTPAAAGPFETVAFRLGSVAAPRPTIKTPALSLKTTKLKRSGKRFSVALSCADAACKGTVSAKYAGGTAAKAVKYSLAAGASKAYKLTLSSKALKALEKKSLLLSVKVTAEGGKAVSKKLRLK